MVILLLVPNALGTTPPGASTVQSVALYAFLLSPVMGAFFAAAAAWYRRFLRLSSPEPASPGGGAKARRRPIEDASGSQKAGARR